VIFGAEGVCNTRRNVEHKQEKIDWNAKEKELVRLFDECKSKNAYEWIVPFSGGKDSTFTVYTLVAKYKLKPLLVCFDHGFMRPTVLTNTEQVVRRLGVDFLKVRANWRVVKKLMLESLRRVKTIPVKDFALLLV